MSGVIGSDLTTLRELYTSDPFISHMVTIVVQPESAFSRVRNDLKKLDVVIENQNTVLKFDHPNPNSKMLYCQSIFNDFISHQKLHDYKLSLLEEDIQFDFIVSRVQQYRHNPTLLPHVMGTVTP